MLKLVDKLGHFKGLFYASVEKICFERHFSGRKTHHILLENVPNILIFYILHHTTWMKPKFLMNCLQIKPIRPFRQFKAFWAFSGSWHKKLPSFESVWAKYPLGILFVKKKYKIWADYRLLSAFLVSCICLATLILKIVSFCLKKDLFIILKKFLIGKFDFPNLANKIYVLVDIVM